MSDLKRLSKILFFFQNIAVQLYGTGTCFLFGFQLRLTQPKSWFFQTKLRVHQKQYRYCTGTVRFGADTMLPTAFDIIGPTARCRSGRLVNKGSLMRSRGPCSNTSWEPAVRVCLLGRGCPAGRSLLADESSGMRVMDLRQIGNTDRVRSSQGHGRAEA